jgi:putative transposase
MRRNKIEVYLHLVWGTWDRLSLIDGAWERRLHRNLIGEAERLGMAVLALNGMPDHVHAVVSLPTTVTIAELVKQLKGVSSRFVNETVQPDFLFKWQGFYGAFSVSRWDVDRVVGYVNRQREHHSANELMPEWEQASETH